MKYPALLAFSTFKQFNFFVQHASRATLQLARLPKIKTINYTRGAQSSWTQEHIWRTKRLSWTPHTHKNKLGVGLALVRLCVWIGANPHPPKKNPDKISTHRNKSQAKSRQHPNNKKGKAAPQLFLKKNGQGQEALLGTNGFVCERGCHAACLQGITLWTPELHHTVKTSI